MSAGTTRLPGAVLIPESSADIPTEDGVALRAKSGQLEFAAKGMTAWSGVGVSPQQAVLARARQLLGLTVDTVLEIDFKDSANYGAIVAGTGSVTLGTASKAGTAVLASGATNGGSASVRPPGNPSWIDNARTSPWYCKWRMKLTTAGDAAAVIRAQMCAPGGGNPQIYMGLIGSLSTTLLAWLVADGGGSTTVSGTVASVTLDTNYHDFEMWNDGTTLSFAYDGVVVATTPSTNITVSAMVPSPSVANGATSANRALEIDRQTFCCSSN